MRKQIAVAATLLAFGIYSMGVVAAQQSPATASPKKPATSAPAQKPPAATTAKKQGTAAKRPLALATQKQKASYAIGLNIGKNMKKDSVDVDTEILARGIRDALAGSKPLLTDDEAKAALVELQAEVRKHQQEEYQAASEKNQKEGEAFLVTNKTKEGVVVLPSGLQYKVLQEGTGPKPSETDTVVCNYRGTLLNNTEFDSSSKHGGPATFAVNQVIKGWTEALQLMPVGSKWELYVPPDLAYGPRAAGPDIGPNSTLIFQVELLSIQPKNPAPEKPATPEPTKPE